MKLTKQQQAVLVGTVLGDAYLQKTGMRNARLRLEHGEKQKDYLKWKTSFFPRLFQGKPHHIERIHPKTMRKYGYWRHQSSATPVFGKWREIFYGNGKKRIPHSLADILCEPLALAVWYMDDGYYYARDRASYLYLGTVTREEALIAQHAIERNFGIVAKIYDKKRKGFALYFLPKETQKLHAAVKKYIVPSLAYKIA